MLTPDTINEMVAREVPGTFAAGYICGSDFIVCYVGRSDLDLNRELKKWVFYRSDCLFFKFLITTTAQEAFLKECRCFHDFNGTSGLKNTSHPMPVKDSGWKCPVCKP